MYQGKIIKAVRGGWPGNDEREQWDFDKAFLYSLTVITTIGKLFDCFLYSEKKMFCFLRFKKTIPTSSSAVNNVIHKFYQN